VQQQEPQQQATQHTQQQGQEPQAGQPPNRDAIVVALRALMMHLDTTPENYDEEFARVRMLPSSLSFMLITLLMHGGDPLFS
jgi:hypothetical protein